MKGSLEVTTLGTGIAIQSRQKCQACSGGSQPIFVSDALAEKCQGCAVGSQLTAGKLLISRHSLRDIVGDLVFQNPSPRRWIPEP